MLPHLTVSQVSLSVTLRQLVMIPGMIRKKEKERREKRGREEKVCGQAEIKRSRNTSINLFARQNFLILFSISFDVKEIFVHQTTKQTKRCIRNVVFIATEKLKIPTLYVRGQRRCYTEKRRWRVNARRRTIVSRRSNKTRFEKSKLSIYSAQVISRNSRASFSLNSSGWARHACEKSNHLW